MKKIFILFILTISIFSLVSCGSTKDITVNMSKDTSSTSKSLIYQVSIDVKLKNMEELEEVAYNVASQIYEQNFETISINHVTLTIHINSSKVDLAYGSIIFDINKSIENPGLSLNSNDLLIS